MKPGFRFLARARSAAVLLATLIFGSSSFADGTIRRRNEIVAQHRRHAAARCKGNPDACAINLLRALTGLGIGVVTSTVGATRSGVAGGVSVDLFSVRYPQGGGDIGKIQALRAPNSRALLQFTAMNLPAVFSCRDANGNLHPPIVGHMLKACVPGARLGFGAVVGELAWDPMRRRHAARWADLAAVINLVGATSSMEYLRGHLDASLRLGVDSVWHGTGESRSVADHMIRGGLSLDGLIRSHGGHWEAAVGTSLRPTLIGTVASFRDFGWTADATGLHHRMVDSTVVSFGLNVRASYWSDPSTSIGAHDATKGSLDVFGGAVLRIRRESKP